MLNLASIMPVTERIKVLTAMQQSNPADVEAYIDRLDGSGTKELAQNAVRMLADSRLALAALEGK